VFGGQRSIQLSYGCLYGASRHRIGADHTPNPAPLASIARPRNHGQTPGMQGLRRR